MMAIALTGIIVIQYFWISNTISEKEKLVDNNISQAVSAVEEQLNDQRALTFISDSILGDFSFEELIEFDDADVVSHEIQHQGDHDVEIKVMSTVSSENDSSQIIIENHHNRIVHLSSDSTKTNEWTHDLSQLESVFNKMKIEVHASDHDMRLDSAQLAKLLQVEFEGRQLGKIQDWAVYDIHKNDYSILPKATQEFTHKFTLFSTDIMEPGRFQLHLSFDQSASILKQVWGMIALSVAFSLILVLVFVFSIRMIIKHKKISQIKSDFINNMTHEFKTPLASITLAADSLMHPNTEINSENVQRYIEIIKEEKNKLNDQVERILEVAALSKDALSVPLEQVSITLAAEQAIAKVHLLIEKNGASIQINCDENHQVKANQFHLEQVLTNIIENAIKYSEGAAQIKIDCKGAKEMIELSISDQGIGMSAKQLRRVFDNFYRVQTGDLHTTKGFGLGLSYCKLILEKMNGQISIQSELGKGTTVIIQIPTA